MYTATTATIVRLFVWMALGLLDILLLRPQALQASRASVHRSVAPRRCRRSQSAIASTDEDGSAVKQAPFTVALCYPSPYRVGMSSLGYQRIYRALMEAAGPGLRARLPRRRVRGRRRAPAGAPGHLRVAAPDRRASRCSRSASPTSSRSRALVRMLDAAAHPAAASRARRPATRWSSPAGPLTFSNPTPLAGIVDAIVVGEAEARVVPAVRAVEGVRATRRGAARPRSPTIPHVFVPTHHAVLPAVGAEDDAILPAYSAIRTPHTELVGHVPHRDRARLLARVHATA